jgi:4-hydroxybenzoate polyprenyltransferase
MPDDRSIENDSRARQYLRSTVFRTCSWLSAGLIVAAFVARSHRIWFIYAAAVLSFCAMLPILRIVPYSRRLDIPNQRDRRFLLFVGIYVALILVGACLVAHFGNRQ